MAFVRTFTIRHLKINLRQLKIILANQNEQQRASQKASTWATRDCGRKFDAKTKFEVDFCLVSDHHCKAISLYQLVKGFLGI